MTDNPDPPAADSESAPATPIAGYRQLNAAEVALVNEGKALAEQVSAFLARLSQLPAAPVPEVVQSDLAAVDRRWLAIGQTDLQKGFMAVTRALTRPTTF